MWGSQVIIPEKLREDIIELLHCTHLGISSTKALARSYVWFPGLDEEIERKVKHCEACQLHQKNPKLAVPHPWTHPTTPWERIHIDFCTFLSKQWLIIVDAYSKWLEVVNMGQNTKSSKLIEKLRVVFSRMGLPLVLVSDNGPQLISEEFEEWLKRNSIHHITTPTYSPASNGLAEALVGKFKTAMTKMLETNSNLTHNLANWLLMYRNTPHPSNGMSPAEVMYGRRTRTALSNINPLSSYSKVQKDHMKQEQKVINEPVRSFNVGQQVLYRDILHKEWRKGIVVGKDGEKVYRIKNRDSPVEVRKIVDQVVAYHEPESRAEVGVEKSVSEGLSTALLKGKPDNHVEREIVVPAPLHSEPEPVVDPVVSSNPVPALRRSTRDTRPPDKLNYHKPGG